MKTMFHTLPIQSLTGTEKNAGPNVEKACENFESFFVSMLMNELQKTANLTEKSFMDQNYMTIVNQKVSEFIAKKGIGIKEVLMRYLEQGDTKLSLPSTDNVSNKEK